ncbi:hypothetical protein F4810DRAFT_718242 [Camillea tinctor]|nr:hypothetical protein F4810DRAFT_718242 [Camillea tinctor]
MNGHASSARGNMEPIAVIGSSCRFPGDATSPSKLWNLLKQPRDILKEIPPSRFNSSGFYNENGEYHGSSNVKYSYLLDEDPRLFDHSFFSISPREAESMDPQQRLLLETVYEGIESAGYSISQLRGSPTSVFVGQMGGDYMTLLLRDVDTLPQYFATGVSTAIMSNRVSYFFDWNGPSATLDTACSSSMVALHQAVQSLRCGESKLAVAAGVNLLLGPEGYIAESKLHMLSPSGRSRMWDKDVDGYARGEGFAALILKPLSQAIADNDSIECLIRNTGVNQDGRTKGITMPSATAQAALIRSTYARSGLNLSERGDRPQFFEAHGTGTPAGDPIEAEAIQNAFFPEGANPFGSKLFVGSVKTIVGHLEGSAGLAGVLKVALAMNRGIIPPNMHFNELNPRIRPFYDHLCVPTEPTPWPALPPGTPRRASVNSFGFGGTNAHAIVESWEPASREQEISCITSGPFVLSANSQPALTSAVKALSSYLKTNVSVDRDSLAYTLSRRSEFLWKASFVGNSIEELIKNLDGADNTSLGTRATTVTEALPPRILGVFTGQGAQWPTMGAKLYSGSAAFRATIHKLEDSLAALPDPPSWSLSEQLNASGPAARIHEAAISQPLCTALQIALVDLLHTAGITFSAVVGHSSGEIGAAYAAGYLSAWDAIRIAYYRGVYAFLAKGQEGQGGSMMAVGMSFDDSTRFCKDFDGKIAVAASNARSSVTLSGDSDAIFEAKRVLDERKVFARLLKVDTAYHSHHMHPCAGPYLESLRACDIQIRDVKRPCKWYSSVYGLNGRSIQDLEALKGQYWVDNMVQTVLFSQAVSRAITEEHCHDLLLELGPHAALRGPTMETVKNLTGINLPYSGVLERGKDDMNAFANALGFVWKNFLSTTPFIDLEGFRIASVGPKEKSRRHILKGLPSYAWDHDKVLFKESRKSKAFRTRRDPVHELLGTPTSNLNGQHEQEVRWRQVMKLEELGWLHGHVFQGQVLFPAAGYVAMAFEASIRLAGSQSVRLVELEDLSIHRAITLEENSAGTEVTFIIRVTNRKHDQISAEYSCYSGNVDAGDGDLEVENFTGRVLLHIGEQAPASLPDRVKPKLPMESVDVERFYSHIAEVDLDYSGDFRVQSIQRRHNCSTVTTKRIAQSDLRVHPATLDAAFHSIFAAYSWPGDGRMWTTYLPTSIERVRVSMPCPQLQRSPEHGEAGMVADCKLDHADEKDICGSINIFCATDGHPEIQVQRLVCSSFSKPGPQDDRKLYMKNTWARDISYGIEPENKAVLGPNHADLVEMCERAAFFYCRKLREEVHPNERSSMEWHLSHLVHWIFDHLLPTIEAGKHPHIKPEWASDTKDMVKKWTQDNPGSIDLELITAVGEALPSILRGTMPALQVMMENNMLYRFYTDGIGFKEGNNDLAAVISQIAHRYPRMNIIEIGAGTGGATSGVLKSISSNFQTYTYTDITAGFFEKARDTFDEYADRLVFKTLDIANDPKTQGFAEGSYDLVVASNVLHATKFLGETMKNCRRLLKPGGYLVLLEITEDHLRPQFIVSSLQGWFHGVEDGRIWAPTVTEAQWDSILRDTGFSGVDTNVNSGFSVMVSRAVDDRVMALHQPLSGINEPGNNGTIGVDHLLILGGRKQEVAQTIHKTRDLLATYVSKVTCVQHLDDFNSQSLEVPIGATVLCLSDLDEPIFKDMNERRFQDLQTLVRNSKTLLWVTQGCRDDNPEANMMVGLGRSLLLEFPDLQLQFLDIASGVDPDPTMIAEFLLRLVYSGLPEYEGILWTTEHEIAVENGAVYIPRIMEHVTLNNRYNSTRRAIHQEVHLSETPVELSKGRVRELVLQNPHNVSAATPSSAGDLQVQMTVSSAYPCMTSDSRALFLSVGSVVGASKKVLVLSDKNASLLSVPADEVVDWKLQQNDAELLQHVVAMLLAESAVRSTQGLLWVHQPDDDLIGPILDASKRSGCRVFLTTSVPNSDPRLQYIHPCITSHDLEFIVPMQVATFINMQQDNNSSLDNLLRASVDASTAVHELFFDANGQKSLSLSFDESELRKIATGLLSAQIAHSNGAPVIPVQEITESPAKWPATTIVQWDAPDTALLKIRPINHCSLFSANKTYLLVGLTGDLGLSICQWMIENGARHLVITSRNPKIDDSTVQYLQRQGAELRIMALDVSDKKALELAHQDICNTMPPIGGVANAAMVLRDKPFDSMAWEDFEKVLRPKVQGSRNLDELFYSADLEFFILFSSLASIFGNKGQSNYGAANMFMTSLASQRRKRGVAASVIHIAMVLGVGYITRFGDQFETQLRNDKIMALSETDFHHLLAEAIVTGRPESHQEVEIITGIGQDTKASWHTQPRFSAYVNRETSVREKRQQKTSGDVRGTVVTTESDEEALALLEDELSRALQNMLQISADKIDRQSPLMDLGIDSLVAVQVRTWFLKELGVDVPVLKILSDASVRHLSKDALSKIRSVTSAVKSTNGEAVEASSAPASTVGINWDEEIVSLYDHVASTYPDGVDSTKGVNGGVNGMVKKSGLSIMLTGSTGFVGTHILRRLSEDPNVDEIHCIAIRPDSQGNPRHISVRSPKIIEYSGNLADDFLGLTKPDYHKLAQDVDAIIHNAAEVNFLKSYRALRQVNVVSTANLAKLATARSIPIHLVSTAAVAFFAENNQLPETSPKQYYPPIDGSLGYAASKWASEVLLERVSGNDHVPVFVHRAVIILGEGAPDTDLMTVVDKYSRKLQALPQLDDSLVNGVLDIVNIEQVADGVARAVSTTSRLGEILGDGARLYNVLNYCSEEKVKATELRQYYERRTGGQFTELPLEGWLDRASELGLNPMVDFFLRDAVKSGKPIPVPSLRKGEL